MRRAAVTHHFFFLPLMSLKSQITSTMQPLVTFMRSKFGGKYVQEKEHPLHTHTHTHTHTFIITKRTEPPIPTLALLVELKKKVTSLSQWARSPAEVKPPHGADSTPVVDRQAVRIHRRSFTRDNEPCYKVRNCRRGPVKGKAVGQRDRQRGEPKGEEAVSTTAGSIDL